MYKKGVRHLLLEDLWRVDGLEKTGLDKLDQGRFIYPELYRLAVMSTSN